MIQALLGAILFGLCAYVGVRLGALFPSARFEDGPPRSTPPTPAILAGACVLGAILVFHVSGVQVVLFALVVCALAAVWYTDARDGIVPDVFTLVPLAIVILAALIERRPSALLSAALAFAPFAVLAVVSKGRGMGWGDVKLAALGGAVLGTELALLAFTVGCLFAGAQAFVRGRGGHPIALAPYLAAAIGIALPLAGQ